MPDAIAAVPDPADTAVARVRAALAATEAVDLADPILRRDLADLTARLIVARCRPGYRNAAILSPGVGRLLARLEAGESLAAGTPH